MRIALICIPALMLSGCGMLPKAEEPVAYQAPAAVAKPAPVVKKAVAPKRVVRKPVVQPTPTNERNNNRDSDGGDLGSPWT